MLIFAAKLYNTINIMGFLIALSALLAIAFVALLIYTMTQSKNSINKKELTQSVDVMTPLGYTFFKEIYIDAVTSLSSTVETSQHLKNVYLKFPKNGERFTFGFNDYIVEAFEFKNNFYPPRLWLYLKDYKEPTTENNDTQPSTL